MFTSQTTVRFSECDGLGHVNNTTYYVYMEEARVEVFRLFIPTLELNSWNLIVAATRCDYLQQVKFAETITTYTWISHIGSSSLTIEHALQNDRGEWVARGQAVMIHYDYATQKTVPIEKHVRTQLQEHTLAPEGVPELRK
ncbi:acyl-CoA thioesterase [Sulfoacidibacillus thermotolerans]|uniref:Thioesterase n=1 Tax=Sulfoacidibacillus thermotolerans TaxID=1765684 RepID=A0A2U3D6Y9_SULT2|nr:thioesterase family protein [Sulfoacidibacillus thermotolerans]PWI57046.1 thioesterase [Sulfoacidibacillus thermotolerans]